MAHTDTVNSLNETINQSINVSTSKEHTIEHPSSLLASDILETDHATDQLVD